MKNNILSTWFGRCVYTVYQIVYIGILLLYIDLKLAI